MEIWQLFQLTTVLAVFFIYLCWNIHFWRLCIEWFEFGIFLKSKFSFWQLLMVSLINWLIYKSDFIVTSCTSCLSISYWLASTMLFFIFSITSSLLPLVPVVITMPFLPLVAVVITMPFFSNFLIAFRSPVDFFFFY